MAEEKQDAGSAGTAQENTSLQKVPLSPEQRQGRNWAALLHLSALPGLVIPFGMVIGPILIWLFKKDEFPELDEHGKEAINFQLSMSIYLLISAFLVMIAIGLPLVVVVVVLDALFSIVAAVNAGDGKVYRYPLSIRFLK